jgi:hypothetical protein
MLNRKDMKTLKNTFALLLLSVGFTYAQNITVQGEKKLNTDFKKYKTFGWMQPEQSGRHLIAYTYEGVAEEMIIRDTEKSSAKKSKNTGKKSSTTNLNRVNDDNYPVVVYSYSIVLPASDSILDTAITGSIEDEFEGRGYRLNQASPDLLVAYKIFDKSTRIKGYSDVPKKLTSNEEVREPQDTTSYRVQPGTLMITLVDTKTGQSVWEGFASGISMNNDVITDQVKVKEAINLIFSKYEFRADKYSANR